MHWFILCLGIIIICNHLEMLTPCGRCWNLVLVQYHLILKKQRCEWCISSKKWPAFSNLSRMCFSFWVGCQPGNTTPWRRRCPKECPQEGLIDRCSMRPSDLGCTGWTNHVQHDFMVETIAQHLRSTLTSWNTCTICTTHTSIIVSYLYMRICHPMKWWIRDDTLFLHAPLKTAKWLMDLLPKLKKKKPMPRGKLKKNSQSLWIPVIKCQEFARLVWQVDDIRTYLHSFAQRITAIQVEWYSLVNICWKRKPWNLKARESKWKCQCFQGCKEWSLRG